MTLTLARRSEPHWTRSSSGEKGSVAQGTLPCGRSMHDSPPPSHVRAHSPTALAKFITAHHTSPRRLPGPTHCLPLPPAVARPPCPAVTNLRTPPCPHPLSPSSKNPSSLPCPCRPGRPSFCRCRPVHAPGALPAHLHSVAFSAMTAPCCRPQSRHGNAPHPRPNERRSSLETPQRVVI